MGVQLGVSYAHFMQMPGKLALPLDCYILVQNQVISYRVKLAFIEIPSIISAVAAATLIRDHRKTFWLTFRTDLTDEQWELLQPLIPQAKKGGRVNARKTKL